MTYREFQSLKRVASAGYLISLENAQRIDATGYEVPEWMREQMMTEYGVVCSECGVDLAHHAGQCIRCHDCQHPAHSGDNYCEQCGSEIAHA